MTYIYESWLGVQDQTIQPTKKEDPCIDNLIWPEINLIRLASG